MELIRFIVLLFSCIEGTWRIKCMSHTLTDTCCPALKHHKHAMRLLQREDVTPEGVLTEFIVTGSVTRGNIGVTPLVKWDQ